MGFTPQDILQVTFGPRCHSTIYCGFGNWSRVHFIFFTFVLWSLYMILLKYRNNKSKVCREPNQIGASFRTQSQWSCIRLVFHFSIYRSISAICAQCFSLVAQCGSASCRKRKNIFKTHTQSDLTQFK